MYININMCVCTNGRKGLVWGWSIFGQLVTVVCLVSYVCESTVEVETAFDKFCNTLPLGRKPYPDPVLWDFYTGKSMYVSWLGPNVGLVCSVTLYRDGRVISKSQTYLIKKTIRIRRQKSFNSSPSIIFLSSFHFLSLIYMQSRQVY